MPAKCFTWGGLDWGGNTGRNWSDFYNWLVQHGLDPQTWAANHPCAFACITNLPPPAGCPGSGGSTPHVTGFSPTSGAPGTTILIQGDGFSGATQVSFGSSPSTNFVIQSDSQIAADVPRAAQQTFDNPVLITVIGPGGEGIAASDFVVLGSGGPPPPPVVPPGPPTISKVKPNPVDQKGTLTVLGSHFTNPHLTSVKLVSSSPPSTVLPSYKVQDDSVLKVTIPDGLPVGSWVVKVTNAKGSAQSAFAVTLFGTHAVLKVKASPPILGAVGVLTAPKILIESVPAATEITVSSTLGLLGAVGLLGFETAVLVGGGEPTRYPGPPTQSQAPAATTPFPTISAPGTGIKPVHAGRVTARYGSGANAQYKYYDWSQATSRPMELVMEGDYVEEDDLGGVQFAVLGPKASLNRGSIAVETFLTVTNRKFNLVAGLVRVSLGTDLTDQIGSRGKEFGPKTGTCYPSQLKFDVYTAVQPFPGGANQWTSIASAEGTYTKKAGGPLLAFSFTTPLLTGYPGTEFLTPILGASLGEALNVGVNC